MYLRTWRATLLALLVTLGAALTPGAVLAQADELRKLDGEWIWIEDRTEGRALEQANPPMSSKFSFRYEEGAMILLNHGAGNRSVRVALDGTPTEVPGSTAGALSRYRGSWKDGVFKYDLDFVRAAGKDPEGLIQREFRLTNEGLILRSNLMLTAGVWSVGLYRQAKDIPMPTPAKATIGDLAWLAGAWVGTRGTNGAISFEERWSPPRGGAMLATSRTVAREKMSAFEFLRIIERDGGLVYVAQPNGAPPTDFVLTELSPTRAVFDNPRHDYPKRIVYELPAEGGLTATIGYIKGGTPRRFEFKREGR
jgi:hypothetical protein